LDTEEKLQEMLPTYYANYLTPNKPALQRRSGTDSGLWWDLTRRRTVHERQTPKIVSTYFGSAGSFAWDESGEFVVVQGYSWAPKKPALDDPRIGLATVAVLCSKTTSRLIAAISNNLAGGQFNLSARFMGKMPFVDMTDDGLEEIVDRLALMGSEIGGGGGSSAREGLDLLVEELFSIASIRRE
jgi:adenine-specific DNA-methyltransferase